MSAWKSLATDDESHDELLAVRPMVAGVAAFGFGDESGFPLEVGACQVIQQDRVSQVEEALLTSRQGGFNRGAVGVEAVEVSIEGIIGKAQSRRPGCRPWPWIESSRAWRTPLRDE